MYIVDFAKNLFKKNNIGTLIWMIANIILICGVFILFSGASSAQEILLYGGIGFLAYLVSVIIALSPIGEKLLQWQNKCHKIKDEAVLNRMMPLFNEVYDKARSLNPEIPDNVNLYMSQDDEPNAFAMGRHTVCFTRGLLYLNDSDIKGILAHEFGHLSHKDTDTLLVITVGNLIVSVMFALWKLFFNVTSWIMNVVMGLISQSIAVTIAGFITKIFIDVVLAVAMALWTKLGVLICLASSRANEYLADKYAYELGLGLSLRNALKKLDGSTKAKGVWAALNSSHPETYKRIEKLDELLSGGSH